MSPKIIIGKMLTKNLPILPSNKSPIELPKYKKIKVANTKIGPRGYNGDL